MTPEVRAAAVAALEAAMYDKLVLTSAGHETSGAFLDAIASPDRARALIAAFGGGLPDEGGVANWPGGGTRVTKDVLGDPTWTTDPDGAWVVLYAPRQFYDGLRVLTEPDTRSERGVLPPLTPIPGLDLSDLLSPEKKAELDANLRDIARTQRQALDAARTMPLGGGPDTRSEP